MPFYEALKAVLETTTLKARRSSWEPSYHISRGFKNACMSVILVSPGEGFHYERYTASCDDMVANDWEVFVDA